MAQLRARFDVIIVRDVDGQAVQYELATNLRDQMELTKRFPKVAENPNTAPIMLVYCAAQRIGVSPEGETLDQFIDLCLDMQLEEPPPLTAG